MEIRVHRQENLEENYLGLYHVDSNQIVIDLNRHLDSGYIPKNFFITLSRHGPDDWLCSGDPWWAALGVISSVEIKSHNAINEVFEELHFLFMDNKKGIWHLHFMILFFTCYL